MIKEYTKTIRAIQWDGSNETLSELISMYPNEIRVWRVNSAIRINIIKYQGDYWVDIGDYIELLTDRVYCGFDTIKENFERIYHAS